MGFKQGMGLAIRKYRFQCHRNGAGRKCYRTINSRTRSTRFRSVVLLEDLDLYHLATTGEMLASRARPIMSVRPLLLLLAMLLLLAPALAFEPPKKGDKPVEKERDPLGIITLDSITFDKVRYTHHSSSS